MTVLEFLRNQSILAVISRFSIIGLLSTIVYFVVANVLIASDVADPPTSSLIAYLFGMVLSFLGQSRITFLLKSNDFRQALRFIIMSAVGLVVSYSSVSVAVHWGIAPSWGTVATSLTIPVLSFLAMKYWIFGPDTQRNI